MSFQVFDKDVDSWTPIRSEHVAILKRISIPPSWKLWKMFSSSKSFTDAYGTLLDTHCT